MARRAQADGVDQADLWVANLHYGDDGSKALAEAEMDLSTASRPVPSPHRRPSPPVLTASSRTSGTSWPTAPMSC